MRIPKIEKSLIALGKSNEIEAVLDELCPKPKSEFNLLKYLDKIEKVFSASSIEEILSNLESDNTDWAKQTIKDLRLMSPTTLKVTLRLLNLGADSSLEECLQMEYCLTLNYLRGETLMVRMISSILNYYQFYRSSNGTLCGNRRSKMESTTN